MTSLEDVMTQEPQLFSILFVFVLVGFEPWISHINTKLGQTCYVVA